MTLGSTDGPGIIEHIETRAVRDGLGRYLLKANFPTAISVFAPDGRFLRSLGRAGGGPGEFRGIGSLSVLPGDSLVVFDWGSSRYSIFSPGLDFVTSGPLPLTPELSSLALRSGKFLFNHALFSPNEVGQPLHLVNRTGARERSFGSSTGVYRPDVPFLMSRAIAESRSGRVWAASRTEYRIDLLNPETGSIERTIRRDVPWFPSGMRPEPRGSAATLEPKPFIFDVREDQAGRLWVLIAVADPQWRSAVRAPGAGDSHGTVTNEQRYRDTVIEVLDTSAGRLLASVRLPQHIKQFVSDNLIGTVMEDADGMPRFFTWQLQLRTP
ncbi:MAG: hypothetical protein KF689_01165 [Gemmatimonadaceae bacterium]|nr:hypothetical protein [Gemmatimonadaceae bacterium]MCW5826540.1 hypothetical protein [Gemmatimonadaceae bacterium]